MRNFRMKYLQRLQSALLISNRYTVELMPQSVHVLCLTWASLKNECLTESHAGAAQVSSRTGCAAHNLASTGRVWHDSSLMHPAG